jgi:hypothetical protein
VDIGTVKMFFTTSQKLKEELVVMNNSSSSESSQKSPAAYLAVLCSLPPFSLSLSLSPFFWQCHETERQTQLITKKKQEQDRGVR